MLLKKSPFEYIFIKRELLNLILFNVHFSLSFFLVIDKT